MHRVVVVALPRVVPFDLAAPCEIFGRVRLADGSPGYDVVVCGLTREVASGPFDLHLRHGLSALSRADTILLPGLDDVSLETPAALVRALRRAAARGVRIASVCSGAFLLASTGLLDGRRATTHWLAAAELCRLYPRVSVDPAVLYVDEGQFLSSAGAAAAFDLCLHMVRRDYGASVAASAARVSVMPLERDGGQSQFIERRPPAPDGVSLSGLLQWLDQNLARGLTTAHMAKRANMSVRNFNRRFREQIGVTPKKWLVRARLRHAQGLLETSRHGVERIGAEVGFRSAVAFREQFRRVVGVSPWAYRRAFRSRP
jgi:transcriptional regulator GlxA family with amidase domain